MRTAFRFVAPLVAAAMLMPGTAGAVDDTQRYEAAIGAPVVGAARLDNLGGVQFAASGLLALTVTVQDDNSTVVPRFTVCQDTDGDINCETGEPSLTANCSNTADFSTIPKFAPKFNPDLPINVFIYTVYTNGACRTAVGTSGQITITYEDPEEE